MILQYVGHLLDLDFFTCHPVCLSHCAIHSLVASHIPCCLLLPLTWQTVPTFGIWERQIRTVRNVMSALLESNGTQLDDEAFRTLLCEVVENLNDPSLEPLTPNHFLTMKTKVVLSPRDVWINWPLYQEMMEKSPAFGQWILDSLEEGVPPKPSKTQQVEGAAKEPSS